MAPAILPQPISQNGPGSSGAVNGSSLALRLDQSRGDRLLRGLVGPEHELEYGVEALAFLDRGFDQSLSLLERQNAAFLTLQQRRVAEEDEAGGGPKLEMAEPELLIDEADGLVGGGPLVGRDADVRERQELENIVIVAPDRAQLILRPAALEIGDNLLLAARS
jgi:hypothetical protein